MRFIFKFYIAVLMLAVLHTAFAYHPVILGSFDEAKYVDGEVFRPVNGTYDFKKFTLKSSQTENYTTIIDTSGFAQFLDGKGNHTINVLEWDKMTYAWRQMQNDSLTPELEKPSHLVGGVKIIDVIVFSKYKLYASPVYDYQTNTLIYIATPSEANTVEMVQTLKFKHHV